MDHLSLLTPTDLQQRFAAAIRQGRRERKLSREALSRISTVPASTIKRFETTGQISLRQFLMLWQCVDRLSRLAEVCEPPPRLPASIDEVLAS
ncbi:MAG: transcriptional regulator [Gammaproteobacteria bacterium]|nr:transcriptional regulator [Gammaproteobacteria bacterium]MYK83367.1 transcriptional regulator [Gammaproteobacteria bacterium]